MNNVTEHNLQFLLKAAQEAEWCRFSSCASRIKILNLRYPAKDVAFLNDLSTYRSEFLLFPNLRRLVLRWEGYLHHLHVFQSQRVSGVSISLECERLAPKDLPLESISDILTDIEVCDKHVSPSVAEEIFRYMLECHQLRTLCYETRNHQLDAKNVAQLAITHTHLENLRLSPSFTTFRVFHGPSVPPDQISWRCDLYSLEKHMARR